MCLQTPPPRTLHLLYVPITKPNVSPRSNIPFWTNQLTGPWMGFQGLSEVDRGAPSLTYLSERSLIIQLPPKQVQLLLLELLLAAHHMYHHAAVCTSIGGHGLSGRKTVTAGTQNTWFARHLQGGESVTNQA